MTPEEAAEGVLTVADAAMERALRVISVERGYDPIDFAVVAFGGAGGLHVAELTARLGAARALVPPDPGLLSAYGMLAAPLTHEASRTILVREDASDAEDRVSGAISALEEEARAAMASDLPPESLGSDGSGPLETAQWIDARYRGQSFELSVPADGWARRFHEAHEERYGYRRNDIPAEAVTVRVVVTAPPPDLAPIELATADGPPPTTEADVFHRGRIRKARRVDRSALRAGHTLDGPLVVQEYSGTTWVPPEWRLEVDRWGILHLTRTSERER